MSKKAFWNDQQKCVWCSPLAGTVIQHIGFFNTWEITALSSLPSAFLRPSDEQWAGWCSAQVLSVSYTLRVARLLLKTKFWENYANLDPISLKVEAVNNSVTIFMHSTPKLVKICYCNLRNVLIVDHCNGWGYVWLVAGETVCVLAGYVVCSQWSHIDHLWPCESMDIG